jgi:decaprenyl-phosphate phosphoribosyltransferase
MNILKAILKVSRPIHWVKNLALFAAIVFSGQLFSEYHFQSVVWAFLSFGFATSSTYILNDILDAKYDRLHPIKKHRPIANGTLPVSLGVFTLLSFTVLSVLIASTLHPLFLLSIYAYLLLQLFYSVWLKNIPVVDILVIATGFVIRVYAGAFVIDAHLSVWFLLCVISVALFLASGKRRAEIGVSDGTKHETRKSLSYYSRPLLNSYVTMFGSAAWLSWALFTYNESPPVDVHFWTFLAEISKTTTISKLLMVTIPVVIFGKMRYEALIFSDRSEAPEKVLLTDKSLVMSGLLWTAFVIFILYGVSTTQTALPDLPGVRGIQLQ